MKILNKSTAILKTLCLLTLMTNGVFAANLHFSYANNNSLAGLSTDAVNRYGWNLVKITAMTTIAYTVKALEGKNDSNNQNAAIEIKDLNCTNFAFTKVGDSCQFYARIKADLTKPVNFANRNFIILRDANNQKEEVNLRPFQTDRATTGFIVRQVGISEITQYANTAFAKDSKNYIMFEVQNPSALNKTITKIETTGPVELVSRVSGGNDLNYANLRQCATEDNLTSNISAKLSKEEANQIDRCLLIYKKTSSEFKSNADKETLTLKVENSNNDQAYVALSFNYAHQENTKLLLVQDGVIFINIDQGLYACKFKVMVKDKELISSNQDLLLAALNNVNCTLSYTFPSAPSVIYSSVLNDQFWLSTRSGQLKSAQSNGNYILNCKINGSCNVEELTFAAWNKSGYQNFKMAGEKNFVATSDSYHRYKVYYLNPQDLNSDNAKLWKCVQTSKDFICEDGHTINSRGLIGLNLSQKTPDAKEDVTGIYNSTYSAPYVYSSSLFLENFGRARLIVGGAPGFSLQIPDEFGERFNSVSVQASSWEAATNPQIYLGSYFQKYYYSADNYIWRGLKIQGDGLAEFAFDLNPLHITPLSSRPSINYLNGRIYAVKINGSVVLEKASSAKPLNPLNINYFQVLGSINPVTISGNNIYKYNGITYDY